MSDDLDEMGGPVVREPESVEQAEDEEPRRGPVGRPSLRGGLPLGRMLGMSLATLALCGGGGARPDAVPTLYVSEEERDQARAQADAANARAAAKAQRPSQADPDKKRRRKAARSARKKNR